MTPPTAPTGSLFDKRLIILGGKGGVGRTTVAAALARAAAEVGKRVLVAQMDAHERLSRLFGRAEPVGSKIVSLTPAIDAVNMTARSALREYGVMILRYEALYQAVFENRPVRSFLSAVPGLDAYAMLGKAWFHTTERTGDRPRYDLVILDGPASGHGTTMLRIPRAILAAMPMGPLARDARAIRECLRDPTQSAFVIVTLAEELPARETVALAHTVGDDLGINLGPLIVNGFPSREWAEGALLRALRLAPAQAADAGVAHTLAGLRVMAARRADAERVLAGLEKDPGLPLVTLPQTLAADLGVADLATFSGLLRGL